MDFPQKPALKPTKIENKNDTIYASDFTILHRAFFVVKIKIIVPEL